MVPISDLCRHDLPGNYRDVRCNQSDVALDLVEMGIDLGGIDAGRRIGVKEGSGRLWSDAGHSGRSGDDRLENLPSCIGDDHVARFDARLLAVGGDECLAASHREPNWKFEGIEIVPGGEEEVSQFGDEHGLD
jgi:hypothetical protein